MTKKEVLEKVAENDLKRRTIFSISKVDPLIPIGGGLAGAGIGAGVGLGVGAIKTIIQNRKEEEKEKRNKNWRKNLGNGMIFGAGSGIIPGALISTLRRKNGLDLAFKSDLIGGKPGQYSDHLNNKYDKYRKKMEKHLNNI